jgi:hypothetical protein
VTKKNDPVVASKMQGVRLDDWDEGGGDKEKPVIRRGDNPELDGVIDKLAAASPDGDPMFRKVNGRILRDTPENPLPAVKTEHVPAKTIPPSKDEPTLEKARVVVAEVAPPEVIEEPVVALPAGERNHTTLRNLHRPEVPAAVAAALEPKPAIPAPTAAGVPGAKAPVAPHASAAPALPVSRDVSPADPIEAATIPTRPAATRAPMHRLAALALGVAAVVAMVGVVRWVVEAAGGEDGAAMGTATVTPPAAKPAASTSVSATSSVVPPVATTAEVTAPASTQPSAAPAPTLAPSSQPAKPSKPQKPAQPGTKPAPKAPVFILPP